ncbi:hypothetical protein J1605_008681 [Eschrichtius robustus]|uniref:Uncharacterized protein n=1 Tax=Eschrichtius robustus TaxID=9764 RepID=A0AB34GW75_ESCRO|nr:hypothetical protein J1605_008681 [Eschrichtius robustus]
MLERFRIFSSIEVNVLLAALPFSAVRHHQNEAPAGGNGAENVAPDQHANPPAKNALVPENPDAQDDQVEEEEEENKEEHRRGKCS